MPSASAPALKSIQLGLRGARSVLRRDLDRRHREPHRRAAAGGEQEHVRAGDVIAVLETPSLPGALTSATPPRPGVGAARRSRAPR